MKDYIDNVIVPKWTEADNRIHETPVRGRGSNDYIVCDDNRLWVGTRGSFHDDFADKRWYFFDENHKLYFVYIHSNNQEYRYYVYDDLVIQYTIGNHTEGRQTKVYADQSEYDTSVNRSVIPAAYAALNSI